MRIRYFAWIKDITNKEDEIIDINHPKTIQELKKYLENLYPELKKHFLQDVLRFAVNQEYVSENLNLKPIDEIAIFPPVSGCLLYTSPSPRDGLLSRMPSSA